MMSVDSDFSMMNEESDFDNDVCDISDDEENVAPPKKGSKPVVSNKSKKVALTVLSPNKNMGNVPAGGKGKNKTVEEMYQKKTQ
jgi:hypothetical protein